MISFPLYDNLLKQVHNNEGEGGEMLITPNQQEYFLQNVKTLDNNGEELIYVLIKVHYLLQNNETDYTDPYDMKRLKKGVRFDFAKFPVELQAILVNFLLLHQKSLETEHSVNNYVNQDLLNK